MGFDIEFEDQGQDLLRLSCNEVTGEITDAGPYHHKLYADGQHFVDVGQLKKNRFVSYRLRGGEYHEFRWPMVKLSLNGTVLHDLTQKN
ncbi:hypothetical protein [Roseobacter sp. TSBP12]|uniref:hypothetical protein n=1 Tax=Roseobacter sp. TSBP12 TaxID=1236613 RepID=UPI00125EB519|nr:hypothetical protein [Roseobacter sp. TSBP12]KAB6717740.1 hypothetical protein C8029_04260 [Roseobacter sp. TSBP12]